MTTPMIFAGAMGANSGVDIGDNIPNSLMMDSNLAQHMTRAGVFDTSYATKTHHFKVKRGKLGVHAPLIAAFYTAANYMYFGFNTADQLVLLQLETNVTTVQKVSSSVYRDPSAWLYITLQVDMTQAVGSRHRIYVGDTLVPLGTNTDNPTYPLWNAGAEYALHIGYSQALGAFFDGYMAQCIYVAGQSLPPASFIRVSPDTGQWVPKNYTGTYGTNGFKLDFTNGAAIGTDSSGNGNHWPLNGGITSANQFTDTPTNNYCVLNPVDSKLHTLAGGNTKATLNTSADPRCVRGSIGVSSGKWYWETKHGTSSASLEWSGLSDASATSGGGGLATASSVLYASSGSKYIDGVVSAYGSTWGVGTDTIGIALDCDANQVTFYKNNVAQTTLALGAGKTWFPFLLLNGGNAPTATVVFTFGARPFAYTPPAGFKALCTANLPTPAIIKPALHFDVKTRTGTGALASIASLAFSPDLAWLKSRSNAYDHHLFDRIRGPNKVIYSDLTAAEVTQTQSLMSFDANGYTLGTSADSAINQNGATFVDWLWKMGGAPVANTAGTIASQVSANVLAGQSIVVYAGTGANATVGHGLGVEPKMVIVKNRGGVDGWAVYHAGQNALPANGYTALNETSAFGVTAASWNNTQPTSSVFSVGYGSRGNEVGRPIVAYCFAEVEGYSKIGRYVGNGSADGPFVHCGFKPRYILFKRADAVSDWSVRDTARDAVNGPNGNALFPHLSNAESASVPFDYVANGIKIRDTGGFNIAGATYIFYAIAEAPTKYSTAR